MNTRSLADLFAEEEERRLTHAKQQIAEDLARWHALSPEEKAALEKKREAEAEDFERRLAEAEAAEELEELEDEDEEETE